MLKICFIFLIEILNPTLEISFIETHIIGRETGKKTSTETKPKRLKDDTVMLLGKKCERKEYQELYHINSIASKVIIKPS